MKFKLLLAFIVLVMAAASCGHNNHKQSHQHEDRLQITGYSDDYEVYAEATPFVAGEESEVLAHITELSDFKPIEKGELTVTLITGKQKSELKVQPSDHKGIFKFKITPQSTGEATLIFDIKTDNATSRIRVGGLKVYSDEHEAEEAAEEAMASSANGVAFTKEMSWKVDFSTVPAKTMEMGQLIRTMGQVQQSQGDMRTITAKSAGSVMFATPDLTEGKGVAGGQTLFRIDGAGIADNNLRVRFIEAQSNYETAKREFERKSELIKEKLVTESELLRAKNEYENARAVYDNLRSGFASGASAVTSPIPGYITQLLVTNGQYVETGQPLATVARNRDLFILAEVPPSYYPLLGTINSANLRRPNSEKVYSLAELDGSIVSYGKSVSTEDPLVPIVFRVRNNADFLPGAFVEMYINAGERRPVVAVPDEAIIEEMGNHFLYVQLTPEYFEKREVKTGRTDGRNTEIAAGLESGERVVARGASLVKLAHSSGTLDAHSGHVH